VLAGAVHENDPAGGSECGAKCPRIKEGARIGAQVRDVLVSGSGNAMTAVLMPYDAREAISVADAAVLAGGRSQRTVRNWVELRGIGRRIAGGKIDISIVALQMLLDGDDEALVAYIDHGRHHPLVTPYFVRLGLGELVTHPQQRPMLHQRA